MHSSPAFLPFLPSVCIFTPNIQNVVEDDKNHSGQATSVMNTEATLLFHHRLVLVLFLSTVRLGVPVSAVDRSGERDQKDRAVGLLG